jgi:DNA repair protein RadD
MLNSNLTKADLVADLEKIEKGKLLDAIDVINTEISYASGDEGFDTKPIRQNKEILAKLHHILNIEKYKDSEFRKKLLLRVQPVSNQIEFLKTVLPDLIPEHITKLDDIEIHKFCDKASKLPWSNNFSTREFISKFDYDESLIPLTKEEREDVENVTVAKINPKTKEITLTLKTTTPFRQLYDYQSKIFHEADKKIEYRMMKFIIQMPTGAGKTRVAMEIVSHFLNRGVEKDQPRQIIWLADREELLEQAIESFQNVFPHLGLNDTKVYRLFSGHKSLVFEKNSIIMANYPTLINFIKENPDLLKPDLIICDEAHNAIAETYKPLIKKFHNQGAKVIGLTATPVRGTETKENKELRDFFNDTLIKIELDEDGSNSPISFLQEKGYLSHINQKEFTSANIIGTIPPKLWKLASKSRELPDNFLQLIAENNDRNRMITTQLLEIVKTKNKKRILYFGTNIYQSKLICALMILNGVNAVHIDGKTPREYRREAIKKFKTGDIDMICNAAVFTTGFDEPKIEVVIIGKPTKSIVLNQQMIGRGMRGPKMGGTLEFDLYTIADNLPGIDLAHNMMQDSWIE